MVIHRFYQTDKRTHIKNSYTHKISVGNPDLEAKRRELNVGSFNYLETGGMRRSKEMKEEKSKKQEESQVSVVFQTDNM